jgi:hypothetical protein
MSDSSEPMRFISFLVATMSTTFIFLLTLATSIIHIESYDAKWYYFVPAWVLLVSNPIACFCYGKIFGSEDGRILQKREDFYRSIGYFEPGDELKALRAKERELKIDYAHLLYVENPNLCRAYHESLIAWKEEDKTGGEAMEKYKSAREGLGDAIAQIDKCKKELDALEPEIRSLEDKEACEAAKETRKMKDEDAECSTESKSQC